MLAILVDKIDGKTKARVVRCQMMLVMEKVHESGEIRYFVTTTFGFASEMRYWKESPFILTGDRSTFTGYMIISDEAGGYLSAYAYDSGRWKRVSLESEEESIKRMEEEGYRGFHISHIATVRTKGGGIPEVCNNSECEGFGQLLYFGMCYYCGGGFGLGGIVVVGGGSGGNGGGNDPPFPSYCPGCGFEVQYCICHLLGGGDGGNGGDGGDGGDGGNGGDGGGGSNPPPVPVSFSLNISSASLIIGDSYTLSVQTVSGNPQIDDVSYKIWRTVSPTNWYFLGSGTPFTSYASLPGNYTFEATVSYDGIKDTVLTASAQFDFPTASEIQTKCTVNMASAWTTTKSLAGPSTCAEVGFVIYLVSSPYGSYYDCSQERTGPITSYTDRARVNLTYDVDDFNGFDPTEGGRFYVADFHTHPPLSNWALPQNTVYARDVGPSDGDSGGPNGIPSFVYDYVGVGGYHLSTDSINSATTITNYGGTQRNNPY